MNTSTASPTLTTIGIEADDVANAQSFYAALGVEDRFTVRHADEPTEGFRALTVSLIVSQPANAKLVLDAAIGAGATVLKPAAKSLWGFGGTVQAPDGTIVSVATSVKKDTEKARTAVDEIVVLLGASDVPSSKRFYIDKGFTPGKSFGSYVEFTMPAGSISLSLYKRKALAKHAGVEASGSGSHRIVLESDAGAFTDPDGFRWV